MDPRIAISVRRGAVFAAALAASLCAHRVSGGGTRVLPIAPVLWLNMIALAVLLGRGRRTATFRARSPLVILATLVVTQACVHLAMYTAPWGFGLLGHHSAGPVSVSAVCAHALAAVVLTALLTHGERLLAAAVAVAVRVFGVATRRPGRPRPALRIPFAPLIPAACWAYVPRTSRGPPR